MSFSIKFVKSTPMNDKIFTVILSQPFAEANYAWLQRFVFYNEINQLYFFACYSHKVLETGFVEFEVILRSASEQVRVLLPSHSIDGILDEDLRKTQPGFLDQ